jgi:hypothetical protein
LTVHVSLRLSHNLMTTSLKRQHQQGAQTHYAWFHLNHYNLKFGITKAAKTITGSNPYRQ